MILVVVLFAGTTGCEYRLSRVRRRDQSHAHRRLLAGVRLAWLFLGITLLLALPVGGSSDGPDQSQEVPYSF